MEAWIQSAVRVRRAEFGRSAAADCGRRGDDSDQGRGGIGEYRGSGAAHSDHRGANEKVDFAGRGRIGARSEGIGRAFRTGGLDRETWETARAEFFSGRDCDSGG